MQVVTVYIVLAVNGLLCADVSLRESHSNSHVCFELLSQILSAYKFSVLSVAVW